MYRLLDPRRKQQKRLKKSRTQENTIAKVMGGKVHPGSGSRWHTKNDASNKKWTSECKTTSKSTFRLDGRVLRKFCMEAMINGRQAAFIVEFERMGQFVVVSLDTAREFLKGFSHERD